MNVPLAMIRTRYRHLAAALLIGSATPAVGLQLAAYDEGPVRVLQLANLEGEAGVQRDGASVSLQAGALVYGGETVTASPGARLALTLGRYGHLDFVPVAGHGAISAEQLPFSSWAADLSTQLRVDDGALSLLWRPTATAKWPLNIALGDWIADVGAGEFLFRGNRERAVVCNVTGWIEVRNESMGIRRELERGQCLNLRKGEAPESDPLVAEQWNALWPQPVLSARSTRSVPSPAPVPAPANAAREPSRVPPAPAMPAPPPATVEGVTEAPVDVAQAEQAGEAPMVMTDVPPPPVQGPEWIINVMTVTSEEMAMDHVQRLTAAGYDAALRAETVRGRASYRVIVPGISSEEGARRVVALLKDKLGYRAAWALQKR